MYGRRNSAALLICKNGTAEASVKQKELEFLEKRLDQKKKKLETLTSEVEKGESK